MLRVWVLARTVTLEFSQIGTPFSYLFTLSLLIAINCVVTPRLLLSDHRMLNVNALLVFVIALDVLYGIIMPLCSVLPPLISVTVTKFERNSWQTIARGVIAGKQFAVGSAIGMMSKLFPIVSSVMLLRQINSILSEMHELETEVFATSSNMNPPTRTRAHDGHPTHEHTYQRQRTGQKIHITMYPHVRVRMVMSSLRLRFRHVQ